MCFFHIGKKKEERANMGNEQGVSNPQGARNVSDRLDNVMDWHGDRKEKSGTRGIVHGAWHGAAGAYKWGSSIECEYTFPLSFDFTVANKDGANAEWKRSADQFSKAGNVGSSPKREKR